MRTFRIPLLAVTAFAFVAACGDPNRGVTSPDIARTPHKVALSAPEPGTCTTLDALMALAADAFGAGSPNLNSVVGKLNNLQQHLDNGNIAGAKQRALDIVEFVLAKNADNDLPGSDEVLVQFVNGVFCYAGLPMQITDPSSSFLVYPADEPQVLVAGNGLAGTSLPSNPVTEPTLITITPLPDEFPPGGGPLDTKLDQYPGYVSFTKTSETNAPFTQPVTVAVCAKPGIPTSIRARLRLGHDAAAGFEITPPPTVAPFLQCPTETAQTGIRGFLGRLASLVTPRALYARQDEAFSGGVGGTAGEYSVFGPVDPEVSFSGGVGGTAGEYLRAAVRASLTGECSSVEAPVGSPLSADCLPLITVQTALNTPLADVPVTWSVAGGNGQIAARSGGVCGTFGSTATTSTSALGKTGVCWTLGDAGLNVVVATPDFGGDVPEGVTFTPATATFSATANPPADVVFMQQPPPVVTAGSAFTVTAMIVDKNGSQVFGSSDAVTLTPNKNAFAGAVPSVTANAVAGLVTFSDLSITQAATDYTLSATSAAITAPNTPPATDEFDVVAGAASTLTIVQGNDQVAAAGTALPVNPTVRVADQYNNPVSGVSIDWTPALSSTGTVGSTPTTTGAGGTASTTWTVGDGANQLNAEISGTGISVTFDALGLSTLAVLNECLTGGGGDPINEIGKVYAFYVPNPGKNKTIREIQVYLSSSGKANVPTEYDIQLTTQLGTFDPAVSPPVGTTTKVFLRGNNSEKKLTTFVLPAPIVGTQGGPPVMIRLQVLSNPDNSTINFNTGECPPGSNCRPPRGCSVTEVNSLTPYPTGTLYRKSVAIVIKG